MARYRGSLQEDKQGLCQNRGMRAMRARERPSPWQRKACCWGARRRAGHRAKLGGLGLGDHPQPRQHVVGQFVRAVLGDEGVGADALNMALLNTPDSEVCSSTYRPAKPGWRRISVVSV